MAAAELLAPDERRTFCRLCNVACGALVTVQDERVVAVRGDREHPVSGGYLCPKGRAMGVHHEHPARLDVPRVRRDGRLMRATWDEALGDLGERITAAGPETFAIYKGTAHYLESAAAGMGSALLEQLGSRSWYTTLTVDCPAVTLVAELVAGHPWLLPVPDLDARLTVLVGTNPMASHGHTFNIARPKEWLRTWDRQGELWVIDPRRSESADVASHHLAPRPGTDHLLFAHLVRELLHEGADRAYLERHASGVATLTAAVAPFTLERAVHGTGVAAEQIELLLARIRAAGKVAMVTGTGLNFAATANLSVWMAWMVSAVTGSLDRPGGMWFNPGYLSQVHHGGRPVLDGTPAPGPASRPELPGRFGELPCAAIVDEIESGAIRTMAILGGNPLISLPQPERVARALASLDALVVVDVIENELAAAATHLLPATGQLERADIPTGPEVYALRSFSQYTAAVLAPRAERRPTWWILAQLARRLGASLIGELDPDAATEEQVLRATFGADSERWQALLATEQALVTPERPYGWVHETLPGQRLRLAPALLVAELAACRDPAPASLELIPRRLLRKNNSTLSDGHGMARPARPQTLLHPEDAARRGIADGATVVIASAHGTLQACAHLDDRVLRGTVSTPHGFADVNVAQLISGDEVDPATGMPQMTGLAVTVTAAPHTNESTTNDRS